MKEYNMQKMITKQTKSDLELQRHQDRVRQTEMVKMEKEDWKNLDIKDEELKDHEKDLRQFKD